MKFSVQVIVHPDDDTEASPVVREVFAADRDDLAPDTLGLQLAEAKDLLAAVQDAVAEQQASAAITKQVACPHCGRARRHKDTRTIVVRSLFGALQLASPRWWHCDCRDQPTRTFQPLAGLLPERTTPELAYLQARFAALVSYGITADLLGELLPLGRRLHPAVVRRGIHAVADRLEGELGEERPSFIDTCQRDREELPRRTSRSSSGWTAATSTPASSGPAPTAGSRSSPARPSPPTGGPAASGMCRPTTPNPDGACSRCFDPRACRPTSRSPSSPTAARTSATFPATSTPKPSTCWTGST
jgi:hypothetical protein